MVKNRRVHCQEYRAEESQKDAEDRAKGETQDERQSEGGSAGLTDATYRSRATAPPQKRHAQPGPWPA